MTWLIIIGFIAIAISIYIVIKKDASNERTRFYIQEKQLRDYISNEIGTINRVIDVLSNYSLQYAQEEKLINLFKRLDTSQNVETLSKSFSDFKSKNFYSIRDSLARRLPTEYSQSFPTDNSDFESFSISIANQKTELKQTYNDLMKGSYSKDDLLELYIKYCPQKVSQTKKGNRKHRFKIAGIATIYLIIISCLIALGTYYSSGLAIGMAKNCYEDSINEKFSQSTLSDAKVESIKYSEFYKSEKWITYMCSDVTCTSDSITELKDDESRLLAAMRELYNKSQYEMEYTHDNGYQINFEYGTWYAIYITIKDSKGNTYKYGRSSKWDDYTLEVNDKYININKKTVY